MLHNNDELNTELLFLATELGNVDELRRLATPQNIHQTDAYGNNLVLQAIAFGQSHLLNELIKPKKKGGFGLSLNVKNNAGNDPVLIAIGNGQENLLKTLIEKKKNDGYGLSIKVENNYHSGAVLTAIGTGNIQILAVLTKPKQAGGYELSLNVENIIGYGPIEIAVINNHVEAIEVLTKDKKYGGYGLTINAIDHLIGLAYQHSCMDTFLWLCKYQIDRKLQTANCDLVLLWANYALNKYENYNDGLKLILCDFYHTRIKYYLKQPSLSFDDCYFIHGICKALIEISANAKEQFIKTFTAEFNRKLFDISCQTAVTWAMETLNGFDMYQEELMPLMIERYKKILADEFNKSIFSTRDCATINSVIKALDSITTGSGQLILANFYIDHSCFTQAFQQYLSIYSNLACCKEIKRTAGFELANIIYNGLVVLVDGELDVASSLQRPEIAEDILKMEDTNLQIMQQRAIHAYEYLHGNLSNDANILRKRLDTILSDHLEINNQKSTNWSMAATLAFHHYYKNKNSMLSNQIQLTRQPEISSSGLGIFNKTKERDERVCQKKFASIYPV